MTRLASRVAVGLAIAAVLIALPCSGRVAAATSGSVPHPEMPQQEDLTLDHRPGERIDSAFCGRCHRDIYDAWKNSVHATAFRDPVFQAGLAEAISMKGPEIAERCLSCHAPGSVYMERRYPAQPTDGVGCHFCHALKGADMDTFPPFEIERGLVMYGPYADAESPAHGTAVSEFMGTAAYCATCHEYDSPAGARILSTFTEFGEGAYSQSLTECQGCHMPLVPGLIVDPAIKETNRGAWIDYHGMEGGRNLAQLRRAVNVEVVAVEPGSGSVDVTVAVENTAAGHWLPTGMPSRRMVLEIATRFEDRITSRSFVFGRRVVDEEGANIRNVARMLLEGVQVVDDTRLRPNQRRELEVTLPMPSGLETTLTVRLYYESMETPDEPPVIDDVVRIERIL